MTAGAGANAGGSDGPETYRVVSPDRRAPLSAQMALEEFDVIHTERPGGNGPVEVFYLRRRPTDDVLEEYGLRLGGSAPELWHGPKGRMIEIHPGKVVIDGARTDIDPEEARRIVRSGSHEPVSVPDGAPDVDGG